MKVIETVAKALPRIQFIFTSHSPLVAGSLEWMNIITLKVGTKTNRTIAKRLKQSIHGLDADQILLTDFFGLKTTIAPAKRRQLDEITDRIRSGDKNAPLQLIREMSSGTRRRNDPILPSPRRSSVPAITGVDANWFTNAANVWPGLPKTPSNVPTSSRCGARSSRVYIDLQLSKCCFCEKPLEGKIEQDVEHFRPKAEVKPWKVPRHLANRGTSTVQQPDRWIIRERLLATGLRTVQLRDGVQDV